MAIIQASDIPSISLLYKLGKLEPPRAGGARYAGSKLLNDRVGTFRGGITTLAVDAIVNAANSGLAGGGGVDGAIHRAAGPNLLAECRTLNGCNTGSAKITGAYSLPCKHVIHAVGPIYSRGNEETSKNHLIGCYETSLKLAADNQCKSIAFSGISTGVYGYPSQKAAPVAIETVRKFLEANNDSTVQKVIFVNFGAHDAEIYRDYLPQYFPPVSESDDELVDWELVNKEHET